MRPRALFADGLLGIVQRLADEVVSVALVARVFGLNDCQGFFETDFLHVKWLRLRRPAPTDARYGAF